MCIAIVKKPFVEISDEALRNCHVNNPDGSGFTYIREDVTGVRKMIIKKSMDFDTFMRQYKRAFKYNPESTFLIHFRIATHGTVDKFNCHPFRINKNMTFIHNGIISGVGVDSKMSDTQLFNEKVLKQLPKGWDKSESIEMLLEKFLVGSKLCTLDIDGNFNIYNEHSGHWKGDIWYSNYTYSYGRRTTYYTDSPYKGYKSSFTKEKKDEKGAKKKDNNLPALPIHFMCDGCGIRHSEHDCTFFVSRQEPFCYCKDCVTVAYFNGTINIVDKVSKFKYRQAMTHYEYGYSQDQGVERFMD